MLQQPKFTDWQSLLDLLKEASEQERLEMLLTMMMTSDERETLVSRINIFYELLKGDLSQRQMSQMLGVGVATITRGSNELKVCSEDDKAALADLLFGKD
ncbi:trp operon repressor [Vibrio mangrovi]|uniref:Trp operon repressor homolog n=1 Tax=Vibrio mangrovi TaxID=474394 RepID=A0A1Y6IWJ2_9VIBR|nr:trp operon repressor [Vibrio mangrovi]MDW6003148.1 trp operon repressor [Vibrio mangrovi]SMS01391.1 Trp operon repressor [Vibrio mangrovi]